MAGGRPNSLTVDETIVYIDADGRYFAATGQRQMLCLAWCS
jgi:hypothetical protein